MSNNTPPELRIEQDANAMEASADGILNHLRYNPSRVVSMLSTQQTVEGLLVGVSLAKEPITIAILVGQIVGHAIALGESRLRVIEEPMLA